jgi:hypothetical protein
MTGQQHPINDPQQVVDGLQWRHLLGNHFAFVGWIHFSVTLPAAVSVRKSYVEPWADSNRRISGSELLVVATGSEVYSSTMAAPLEFGGA